MVNWEKPGIIRTEIEYAAHIYNRFLIEIIFTEIGDMFVEFVSHDTLWYNIPLFHILTVGHRLKVSSWRIFCKSK